MAPVCHYLVSRWLNMMKIPPSLGHITTSWAYYPQPGIPGDPWDVMGSLGFHRIPHPWDPRYFMGSLGQPSSEPGIGGRRQGAKPLGYK